MQIEIKQLPKSEIQVIVTIPTEEMETFEAAAFQRISDAVEIPGYRKGTAPKAFIIAKVGADAFFSETLNIALPRTYFKAVKEKNIPVISRPAIKVLSKSPLKYEARAAVMPEVTLKGVDKLKIENKPANITDAEIEEVVAEMRKYSATHKPLARPTQKGDRVEIDFQGYDEKGAPVEKTKSANHPLFIGEGTLVNDFENALIGMQIGEKKRFPVTFPGDYHFEPLRGKTIHFETQLKKGEETILPELTDEFVAKIAGEPKTISQFKEEVKADLARRKAVKIRRERENALLDKLNVNAKLDVPPILVEEEIDYMISDLKRELAQQKLAFESYEEQLKKAGRDLRAEYGKEAEKRIRIRLILNHLFREFRIEAAPEEFEQAASRLISRTQEQERGRLQEELKAGGEIVARLKNNIMLEKLFAKFLD